MALSSSPRPRISKTPRRFGSTIAATCLGTPPRLSPGFPASAWAACCLVPWLDQPLLRVLALPPARRLVVPAPRAPVLLVPAALVVSAPAAALREFRPAWVAWEVDLAQVK